MRPHGVMTETTELVARHGVLALLGETCAYFRDKTRDHHGVHIGIGEKKAMYDVGTGEAKLYRCPYRHLNAMRHEFILFGNDPHRDGSIGLDGGAEIALDEFPLEMKSRRIDDLDIAGRVHRTHDAGQNHDCHHDKEHRRHYHDPAPLSAGDDLFRDDAVRQQLTRWMCRLLSQLSLA